MNLPTNVEMIHESEGLRIYENPKNQFTICYLHYTADPRKRTAQWLKEAQAGMSPAKFAREYEIDFGAVFGERVFPELLENIPNIVIPKEKMPIFPTTQVYYGGFDFGIRNPTSFHIYTLLDGVLYAVWELYEPCVNIIEYSAKMRSCPYWESIRYIAADPHIQDLRHYGEDGAGASIRDQFREQGIKKFVLAPNKEDAWVTLMRKHWADPDNITFKISSACPYMIEEFKNAVYADYKGALGSANKREAIADVNNHAMDDCKYFMLVNPIAYQQTTFKWPTMVNKWAK